MECGLKSFLEESKKNILPSLTRKLTMRDQVWNVFWTDKTKTNKIQIGIFLIRGSPPRQPRGSTKLSAKTRKRGRFGTGPPLSLPPD